MCATHYCLLLAQCCTADLELTHLAQLKFCAHWLVTTRFPLPQALTNTIPCFNSMNLTLLHSFSSEITQHLSFCSWFISLCIMSSLWLTVSIRFTNVVIYSRIFLCKVEMYPIVYAYHIFLIHLGLFGDFHWDSINLEGILFNPVAA